MCARDTYACALVLFVVLALQGRTVLWGWMQEKPALRPAGEYNSSCCLCVPRVLYLSPGKQSWAQGLGVFVFIANQQLHHLYACSWYLALWQLLPVVDGRLICCRDCLLLADGQELLQEPLPELKLLRQQHSSWSSDGMPVSLLPGCAVDLAGNVSRSSHLDMEVTVSKGDSDSFAIVLQPFGDTGVTGAAGAAISYCWKTNTLQVRAYLVCFLS